VKHLIRIGITVALLAAALSIPATTLASSNGACGSSSTINYKNGMGKSISGLLGATGKITVPSSTFFAACAPDDNAGVNGPSAWVGLSNTTIAYPNTAWVQAGLARVYNCSYAFCDIGLRFFSEWREGTFGATLERDLGAASYNTEYTVTVLNHTNGDVDVYINGVLKTTWATGGQLIGTPNALWKAEIHDVGDGEGNDVAGQSTNMGSMRTSVNGGPWTFIESSCNANVGSEIACVKNGTSGMYFYTFN
jgi:hypothetical protein